MNTQKIIIIKKKNIKQHNFFYFDNMKKKILTIYIYKYIRTISEESCGTENHYFNL